MKCQHCGHPDTSVLATRALLDGAVLTRRRSCDRCGQKFSTYEIDDGIWGTVKRWALDDHLPALEKKHALRQRNEQIVALLYAGTPHKKISERFGISTSTICYVAKKAGLPGRRGPERVKLVNNPWVGLLRP